MEKLGWYCKQNDLIGLVIDQSQRRRRIQRNQSSDQLPSMEEFLSYMGLDKLIPILQEQEVDLPTLMTLNEEDLKRVGVK